MKKKHLLSKTEEIILLHKGTEKPFSHSYDILFDSGVYVCKQCDFPLYLSENKFDSGCGWPSFDEEIKGHVLHIPELESDRTEIICARCKGHLGHLFLNEHLNSKETRHCVNGHSLQFVGAFTPQGLERAVFAGGCFWGPQALLKKEKGVIESYVGYTGGEVIDPTYEEVGSHNTGHVEAVELFFDPEKISYETLLKLFFEIHDFSQKDGQGPDIGPQYLSRIFYYSRAQKKAIDKVMEMLKHRGYKIATEALIGSVFYKAEGYHQNYLDTHSHQGCHIRKSIF